MKYLLIALALCSATPAFAANCMQDCSFQQERMVIDHGEIFVVSSFERSDLLTAYDFNGNDLWEIRFDSKILSWEVQDDLIFVFSKSRLKRLTFVNCIDRRTGTLLWERG